ncbi:MAG: ribosome small subunit-dependent GTPase A, partial [Caldilineaceae bacterium]
MANRKKNQSYEALEVDERRVGRKPRPKRDSDYLVPGIVMRARGHHFDVRTHEDETFRLRMCELRGRLLQERSWGTLIAVGDRVWVQPSGDRHGLIERIDERHSVLSRQDPSAPVSSEDVILANPDQVLIVFAAAQPEPHLRMVDRFLVVAEANELPSIICVNKVDLVGIEAAQALFATYARIGYPVIYASATDGLALDELRAQLANRITVFTGPSGVGKSSLLNALEPALDLRVGELREVAAKGKHTTRAALLLPLPIGDETYVADTPGIRELGLFDMDPANLQFCFVEMKPHLHACRFPSCTHDHEPECAVRSAVEQGEISVERYE